jgi:LAS superfamily LD-carboxypeptidase LdcB
LTELDPDQAYLTGRDESQLVELVGGHRLEARTAAAFAALQADGSAAGFDLAIASSYRSFERQCAIWNGKALGQRDVHDDSGAALQRNELNLEQWLHAILRFSALPGTSRHHWGSDLDVYDAAAVAADYQVQLTPQEVAPDGVFDPLHCWLDEQMAAGQSHGFYRPYTDDRGGVAPERWHLSYAPVARPCETCLSVHALRAAWDSMAEGSGLVLRELVEVDLEQILARYVAVAPGWCPADS